MMIAILIAVLAGSPVTQPPYASEFRFEDFATAPEVIDMPHPPRIAGKRSWMFRTQLRRAAAEGPNFAGHLKVATWGCGACCSDFGIIDLRTGGVWMPPFYMSCGYPQIEPVRGQAGLYYRPDSTLFIAVGSKNEGAASAIYYYRWNGRGLELLKSAAEVKNE